ncbi:MAG: protein translocase SEC61 complex gamma subunit, archaeal and eukaryotic [uncultured Acidilobus sp. CIS]|jgi:protein transport protein SEC61 subunit gamma-like protein|nr:MAG: protein translocase SEC61 complex gamma subunit, archaeal and eukaryotic [uncultured Acidilobus sp. CIS]
MGFRDRLKNYVAAWRRVVLLSRKPDEEEFSVLTRLTIIGFLLVGVLAYIIHLVYVLLIVS